MPVLDLGLWLAGAQSSGPGHDVGIGVRSVAHGSLYGHAGAMMNEWDGHGFIGSVGIHG